MGATYRHNYAAFGRLVLNSPMMETPMRRKAEKVQERFIETAPVSDEPDNDDVRRYKDSSEVSSGLNGGLNNDRAYGRVTVNHRAAMAIEYGHRARRKDGEPGEWVEGSYTLTNALRAAEED